MLIQSIVIVNNGLRWSARVQMFEKDQEMRIVRKTWEGKSDFEFDME